MMLQQKCCSYSIGATKQVTVLDYWHIKNVDGNYITHLQQPKV